MWILLFLNVSSNFTFLVSVCLSAVDKIRGLTLTKTFVLSDAISNFLWWYHKKNLLTTPLVCTQQHMAAIKINI